MQDVAQRLLDLSRARAMTIALERRKVDLREVIASGSLKIFAPAGDARRAITLDAALPRATALTIAGDATKLTWALSNLLSNALRYTPAGGRVELEATPQRRQSC